MPAELIGDAELAALLGEVLDAADGLAISFFEATVAASFLAFARHPADACVIEVGLGGRFDATNVLARPAACGIATLGIDHEAFLLAPEEGVPAEPLARIAFEKASIAKPGAPLVTQAYPRAVAGAVAQTARLHRAELFMRGQAWGASVNGEGIEYYDCYGPLTLPRPALAGAHQADNAALAAAMLRHQDAVKVSPEALAQGIRAATWPGRLQQLGPGPLTALVPGRQVWLDGGHNPDAGAAIAAFFGADGDAHPAATGFASAQQVSLPSRKREGLGVGAAAPHIHLVLGMLANKPAGAILDPLAGTLLSVSAVPIPGHETHPPGDYAAHTSLAVRSFADIAQALAALPPQGDVLIAGSLYLAGEALRLNRELPD